jgi:hypothetical protein
MEEVHWIAMPGVPLITAEGIVAERGATADVRGDGADAQCDDTRVAEEVVRPEAEAMHDAGAEGPLDDVERAVATMDTIVHAFTSAGTAAAPEGDAVPAPNENARAAASTREAPGGNTSEMAHAAELEATLLAAASPEREAPPEPAAAESTETPLLTAEAEV